MQVGCAIFAVIFRGTGQGFGYCLAVVLYLCRYSIVGVLVTRKGGIDGEIHIVLRIQKKWSVLGLS